MGWLIIGAAIVLLTLLNIWLRRFKWRKQVVSISDKLVWLFLLGILGRVTNNDSLLWFSLFSLLIFLKMPLPVLIQSVCQIAGDLIVTIKYGSRLPKKESYDLKNKYILPFSGKWTVVNGGVDKALLHGGNASQRFAYDFIILDDEGKSFLGDERSVGSYYCYGKDVLAPADGTVVHLRDNHRDSYVDGKKAYCDAGTLVGNVIVIRHDGDEHSLIAHLMPRSAVVRAGDKVKQGDIVAKCGNSGNTSQPHIHFQLQKGRSFFLSPGLPIAFTGITARPKTNYNTLDQRPTDGNLVIDGNITYIGRGLEVEN